MNLRQESRKEIDFKRIKNEALKMNNYGENDKQGQYWNEAPGQSWVINDTAMNERLQNISDILFEGIDVTGCKNGLDIGCGACLLYTSPSPRDS